MLNGKFFTGLPPKMIDKNCPARNRMESHFFWPDDSRAESAVDIRLKRRNSMQASSDQRPLYEKQMSIEPNEVDTKERFSKEFSKSSIQFYDNLNDSNAATYGRRNQVNSRGVKKSEIAEKPTATKLELPESIVDEAYTTAKKKQAYTSKIQFYDFVNEEEEKGQRNNMRKPKMDMNNKREMELNSKNSPKLQPKRDVRSLSEEKEMPKLNNREVKTLERPKVVREKNVNRSPIREEDYDREEVKRRTNTSPHRIVKRGNNSYATQRIGYRDRDEGRYYEGRLSISPQGNRFVNDTRLSRERDIPYRKSNNTVFERSDNATYRNPEDYEYRRNSRRFIDDANPEEFREEYPTYRSIGNDIKRYNNRSPSGHEEELGYRMKSLRVHQQSPSPPQRRQYYHDADEPYDESPRYARQRSYVPPSSEKSSRNNVERQPDMTYVEEKQTKSSNYNRVNNNLNNENPTDYHDYTPKEKVSQKTAAQKNAESGKSSHFTMDDTGSSNNNSTKKHLRSSLCFHDGAIMAENEATQSTPTSSTQRRNARSSATKRVSVGLPEEY